MQSFTVTQWAIVVLVFVAGWLLGLASHPGGRKWRDRYTAEREAHAQARRDADARVAAVETQHRETLAERERLDRERAHVAQSDRITVAPRRP
jgi:type VI protein secretion system component VasK